MLSFSIASRTREIGIRLALGAGTRNVFNVALRDGLILVAAGMAIGVLCALVAGPPWRASCTACRPADPTTFVVVSAVLAVVALVACVIPARRAMRMDPNRGAALRVTAVTARAAASRLCRRCSMRACERSIGWATIG